MKIEIIKIIPSTKFNNKYFVDVKVEEILEIRGVAIVLNKKALFLTLPNLPKENSQPFSPIVFTSKDIAIEFRTKIKEEFLKHAAAGTLRPDIEPKNDLPRAMDKPSKSRNVFSKKRIPFKRGPQKKNDRSTAEATRDV